VIVILIASNPDINFIYSHITDSGEYRFSSAETKEYLKIESLYDRNLLEDIGDMIRENLKLAGSSGYVINDKTYKDN